MAKASFYKIKTVLPRKKTNLWASLPFFGKGRNQSRRRNLFLSVIGVYAILSLSLGYIFLRPSGDVAKASETAYISSSIRFKEEKKFKVGEKVDFILTLQNTSTVESINTLHLDLLSTQDALKWNNIRSNSEEDVRVFEPILGTGFNLPNLSSNERVEYTINGTLQNDQLSYLTVLAKLKFINKQGLQEAKIEPISLLLNDNLQAQTKLLQLKTDKESYAERESVQLTVNRPSNPTETEENTEEATEKTEEESTENSQESEAISSESSISDENGDSFSSSNSNSSSISSEPALAKLKGKIYIVNRKTQEPVASLDCQSEQNEECVISTQDLVSGSYSAMFMDNNEEEYSEIGWFEVGQNQTKQFTPNSQAVLNFPFGLGSINGLIAVNVQKVVSLNQVALPEDRCTFEILQDAKLLNKVTSVVNADRSCNVLLGENDFNNGDGLYTVRLSGSSLEKEISYLKSSEKLIALSADSTSFQKDLPVDLTAENITNSQNEPSEDAKVSLIIFHPISGQFKEIKSVEGETLKVTKGKLKVKVPAENFRLGGLYQVLIKLEDGQISNFVSLNFEDKEVGLPGSGISLSSANYSAGEAVEFSLRDITDRNGNLISEGQCTAQIYQTADALNFVTADGTIKQGLCQVDLKSSKLTKSGPALVTFTGQNMDTKINQSRQFVIHPSQAVSYGKFSMEYEPVRKDFANNLIIGPVTDPFGNLANSKDLILRITDPDKNVISEEEGQESAETEQTENQEALIKLIDNLEIKDGFAIVPLPSSYLQTEKINFLLKNKEQNELLNKTFVITENNIDKLILPNFPKTLAGDENLEVGITNLVAQSENCKLQFFQTIEEFAQEEAPFDPTSGKCEFNWKSNKFRSNNKALAQITVSEFVFSQIVDLKAGEASNLFVITPQLQPINQNDLLINLLTSPIVDRNGKPLESGKLRWQYNGRIMESNIENGLAKTEILASNLQNKDIKVNLNERNLEIDLDAKAGSTSISRTGSLSIFLGNKDIATQVPKFALQQAASFLTENYTEIFRFDSPNCKANLFSDTDFSGLKTHWQGGSCFVQLNPKLGSYNLIFEENGFVNGQFALQVGNISYPVKWCKEENKQNIEGCLIQILGPAASEIEVTVFDQDKEYKFNNKDLENALVIKQNGLNPLKKYLVKVSYTSAEGKSVDHYREILGDKLE